MKGSSSGRVGRSGIRVRYYGVSNRSVDADFNVFVVVVIVVTFRQTRHFRIGGCVVRSLRRGPVFDHETGNADAGYFRDAAVRIGRRM